MKKHQRAVTAKSSAHLRKLHGFINRILEYAEEPASWPMTQEEKNAFVRVVIFNARKLRDTEEFIAAAMLLAAEDLALAS